MARGRRDRLVRPSRDEEARLRYLTYQTMGALLVQFLTTPEATPEEFVASLRDGSDDTILPMLELFTEGLLADRGDARRLPAATCREPPDGSSGSHPPTETATDARPPAPPKE